MNEPSIMQRLLREKALGRYLNALERGDISTIIRVLEQAERDLVLERMILEVHETYQTEEEFLAMVQEESLMEFEEGIHKSHLKGQQDEPAERELLPEPAPQQKRNKPARWLQALAAVLLVCIVVGGYLLIHNARGAQTATVPHQQWCAVPGNSAVLTINQISAVSARNLWAIGEPVTGASSVFEHWDGSQWSMVNSPTLTPAMTGFEGSGGGITATLADMHAFTANDIWAVGVVHVLNSTNIPMGGDHGLIEHWDGSKWQFIKSPDSYPSSSGWNDLNLISASSASDIWAAGFAAPAALISNSSPFSTLLEHWNGQAWSLVALPTALSKNFQPESLAAVAPDNAWLVGYTAGIDQRATNHFLHWDGKSWSEVRLPTQFGPDVFINAVTGNSAKNIWAFGSVGDVQKRQEVPLIIHWDGSQWTSSPVAPVGKQGSILSFPVAVDGANNIWVAGRVSNGNGAGAPFLEHWDGQNWKQISLPAIQGNAYISSMAVAGSKVWVLINSYDQAGSTTSYFKTNC